MNHKNLEVWKEAITLAKHVYSFAVQLPMEEKFGLTLQLKRSAVSIGSNIAEGSARKTDKEFINFLSIARGSLAELETQLILAKQLFDLDSDTLSDRIEVVGKLLNGLINYLKKSQTNIVKENEANYSLSNDNSQMTNDYFSHENAVIDKGCQIGKGTKIWHFSHIMSNCSIGENCNIGQNVVVSPDVVLGNNVKVQNNVSIYTGVICEDDVFLGPSMVFTNVINPRSAVARKDEYKRTLVKKGATIGANATIVCGHDIGEYAFIGAGAVVTKEVPAYALVVGNPAKHIGWMSEYGHRLSFNDEGYAICPESKEKYVLQDSSVRKQVD